jgi:hypothetical protein
VQHVPSPDRRAMPFFGVTVGASCVFMVSHQLVFRSAGVARYGYLELLRGGGEFELPPRLQPGAGIAADRYLRVRLAPATMTASSTTLGCHGNYGNPRTHGVARQQHLKTCISDRPSHAETVETALQSLELDFATRLEQEALPLPAQLCGHTWHWHCADVAAFNGGRSLK